jgi:predicted nucleic acid-binding protein
MSAGAYAAANSLANALIDTGAILAILNRENRWHSPCVTALRDLRLPLLTAEAVLTELFHPVSPRRREPPHQK